MTVYGVFVFCAVRMVAQPARFRRRRRPGAWDLMPGGRWIGKRPRPNDSGFALVLAKGALWGIRRNNVAA
jgi:hypothetical protein